VLKGLESEYFLKSDIRIWRKD